jgi:hypothetical protein
VKGTSDWDELVDQLGIWMTIHGVLMVISGLAFGLAVVRAGVLPRWTGLTLMAGVVLIAVSSGLPDAAQTASAGVRDLAFAGMGASLLVAQRRRLLRRGRNRDRAEADAPSTRSAGVPAGWSG